MIKRVAFYLFLCALSTASCGELPKVQGAWLQMSLHWTKPPAELQLKQRSAEAAMLYFGPDHEFVMVYGTVIEGPQSEGLSHGDGRVVYLGKWSQHGAALHVEYRLVSRTVLKQGEILPGQIEAEEAVMENGSLLLGKVRFRRELRLESDLEAVGKGERARLSR